MKENINVRAYFYQGLENDPHTLFVTFAISTICHLIFFVALIFVPLYIPARKFSPSVINVSLVSLPLQNAASMSSGQSVKPQKQVAEQKKAVVTLPPQNAAAAPSEQIAKPEKQVVEQKKAPVAELSPEAVSLTKKKNIKKSLKKETFSSSKVVESAIKRIEKQVEESRPNTVTEAIERLKNQVGQDTTRPGLGQDTTRPGLGIAVGPEGGGGKQAPELLVYQQQIAYYIRENWVFSEQLAGKRTDLEVRLLIKILENGNIEEIWFEKRSGNNYLDESAYKAIKKSNPLPPLPKGIRFYNVLLGFTPSGLQ